jgi:Fic family protein
MPKRLTLLSPEFTDQYAEACEVNWSAVFRNLKARSVFTAEDFEYYIIAASLFSSKIEGNSLDLNSFMNNRGQKTTARKKEFNEIEDLAEAYRFASGNNLTRKNFLDAHGILSRTILKAGQQGKFRNIKIGVFDNTTGRPVYLATEPELVKDEVTKLFADIEILIEQQLTYKQVFYYASMIHLWVAMIHPFADGNGRIARLTEKWFLDVKLGKSAWAINTEQYYWEHRSDYYKNISLGYNYYALKWERCVPFLLMLPNALKKSM